MRGTVEAGDLRREIGGVAAHAGRALSALLSQEAGADLPEGAALLDKVCRALEPLVPRVRRAGGGTAAGVLEGFIMDARALQAAQGDVGVFWEAVAGLLRRLGSEVVRALPGGTGERGMPPGLLDAYEDTDYVVEPPGEGAGSLVLRHGERSPALERLLEGCRPPTAEWTVITAWNPRSSLRSERENVEAQGRLERRLRELGYRTWRARGRGRDGWEEESLLVHGLGPSEARWLAREFEQVAVLCGQRGGAAEIVLCGPTPEWTGAVEGSAP